MRVISMQSLTYLWVFKTLRVLGWYTQPLVRLFGRWRGRFWPGGAAWGRECRRRSSGLPLNLSDTVATSQDGSSLEFIAPIAGR